MMLDIKQPLMEVCFDGGDSGYGLEHVYNMFTHTKGKENEHEEDTLRSLENE